MKVSLKDSEKVFVPYDVTISIKNEAEHNVLLSAMSFIKESYEACGNPDINMENMKEFAIAVTMVARKLYGQIDCYFHIQVPEP